MKRSFALRLVYLLLFLPPSFLAAGTSPSPTAVQVQTDLPYKSGAGLDAYEQERCKLDVYLPANSTGFPTLVWFHGGSLTEGRKEDARLIARRLAEQGIAVVTPNYRLNPRASFPAYVDDAAAAVAWAIHEMPARGANPGRIFLGGHSAGAYLVWMTALDERFLAKYGCKPTDLAGLIPTAGQVVTHYTVRRERGLAQPIVVDDAAPLHYVKNNLPPLLVVWAEHDMAMRGEQNAFMVAALKDAGQKSVQSLVLPNRDHGTTVHKFGDPDDRFMPAVLEFVLGPRS